MTVGEQGFLLLTCILGDPERKPLTLAQFRELTRRCRTMEKPTVERDMEEKDLVALGFDRPFARRVLELLSHQDRLEWYLEKAKRSGCQPVTRLSSAYPGALRKTLAMEAPACLWAKGDFSILDRPRVSLVGSRELWPENRAFAQALGEQAAKQGYVLVSGNARGADQAAQESCLAQGGSVICVVADALQCHDDRQSVLYLAEEGFDIAFSSHRALSRNRIIHSLSERTFVAQCTAHKGGTWEGTTQNLRQGLSNVFCFQDGSEACRELTQMGAVAVTMEELDSLFLLGPEQMRMF